MSLAKKIFGFIEKRYSIILLFFALVFVILIAIFYWNLYSNIILKKVKESKELELDQATLNKVIEFITAREQNYFQSLQKQYKDIFQ
jgi:hypothetical protein